MAISCASCGAPNFDSAVFCTTCGTMPLTSSAGQAGAAASPQPIREQPPLYEPGQIFRQTSHGYQQSPSTLSYPPPQPSVALPASSEQPAYTPTQSTAVLSAPQPASAFLRWIALIIDTLVTIPLYLLLFLPIIGSVILSLLLMSYWLLRDVKGASLGKLLLGLRVVGQDGRPATAGALMGRNILFAAPHLIHLIPYLGTVVTLFLLAPLKIIEGLLVVSTGLRLGDRMAGTVVKAK